MKPPDFFDSNIYIKYGAGASTHKTWLCSVVVQEMTAGAKNDDIVEEWENAYKRHQQEGRLVTPNAEDWFLVGKILNSLLRSKRSRRYPDPASINAEAQRRIVRDALIARCVKSVNGLLVTENMADFLLLRRFCNVRVVSGKNFFGY